MVVELLEVVQVDHRDAKRAGCFQRARERLVPGPPIRQGRERIRARLAIESRQQIGAVDRGAGLCGQEPQDGFGVASRWPRGVTHPAQRTPTTSPARRIGS